MYYPCHIKKLIIFSLYNEQNCRILANFNKKIKYSN